MPTTVETPSIMPVTKKWGQRLGGRLWRSRGGGWCEKATRIKLLSAGCCTAESFGRRRRDDDAWCITPCEFKELLDNAARQVTPAPAWLHRAQNSCARGNGVFLGVSSKRNLKGREKVCLARSESRFTYFSRFLVRCAKERTSAMVHVTEKSLFVGIRKKWIVNLTKVFVTHCRHLVDIFAERIFGPLATTSSISICTARAYSECVYERRRRRPKLRPFVTSSHEAACSTSLQYFCRLSIAGAKASVPTSCTALRTSAPSSRTQRSKRWARTANVVKSMLPSFTYSSHVACYKNDVR